jgi:hypothetical protein
MPYIIVPFKNGFRLCKKNDPSKCFSNKPLTKTKAKKQMMAIGINEHKGGMKMRNLTLNGWNEKEITEEQKNSLLKESERQLDLMQKENPSNTYNIDQLKKSISTLKGGAKEWSKKINIDGEKFIVKKSTRKNKKYDVYFNDEYLLSYGDKRYQHYLDKFKQYSDLNHKDKKRQESYFKRHGETDDIFSAKYWSNNYLW